MPTRESAIVTPPGFVLVRFEIRQPSHNSLYGERNPPSTIDRYIHVPAENASTGVRAYYWARDHELLDRTQVGRVTAALVHICQRHRHRCDCPLPERR